MSDAAAELSPYSPLWPAVFDMEKRRLLEIFNDAVLVEHVGSTAVPGLVAKPIIDILVGAPSLAVIEARIPALVADGYRYVPEFERAIPDRRYFTKVDQPPGKFHLHAVVVGSPFWKRVLVFRDALRADERLAQKYLLLKQRLATKRPEDRAAHVDARSDFIRSIEGRKP